MAKPSSAIFSGEYAKMLKSNLQLMESARILTGEDDPTVVAKEANKGSLYLRQTPSGIGQVFSKLDDGLTTNWKDISASSDTSDILVRLNDMFEDSVFQQMSAVDFGVHGDEFIDLQKSGGILRNDKFLLPSPGSTLTTTNLLSQEEFVDQDKTLGRVNVALMYDEDAVEGDHSAGEVIHEKNSTISGFGRSFNDLAIQSDGKFIGVKSGSSIDPKSIVRYTADGEEDLGFSVPGMEGQHVSALVSVDIQSDGKILVAGDFIWNASLGLNRRGVLRINPNGSIDEAFCANASDGAPYGTGGMWVVKAQADGKILLAGENSNIGGTLGRDLLIRLNSDGTLDEAFCINASDGGKFNSSFPNRRIRDIAIQADGKILIGGYFQYGAVDRLNLIRLNSDGTLDEQFCENAVDGKINVNGIWSIAVQPDGKILVGGEFSNYDGVFQRNNLIRLNSDGTVDNAFCINAVDGNKFNSSVRAVSVQSDGQITVGGRFSITYSPGKSANLITRLNADGTLDEQFSEDVLFGKIPPLFNPSNEGVLAIAALEDRRLVFSGPGVNYMEEHPSDNDTVLVFTQEVIGDGSGTVPAILTEPSPYRDSLYVDKTPAVSVGSWRTALEQPDGKLLLGGYFEDGVGSTDRTSLVRLKLDGSIDSEFQENVDGAISAASNSIVSIKRSPNGKTFICGSFVDFGGVAGQNSIVALNDDGTSYSLFNNAVLGKISGQVSDVVFCEDGKIAFIGGFIYSEIPNLRNIVRLNKDLTLDLDFVNQVSVNKTFSGNLLSSELDSLGNLYISGDFTSYDGDSLYKRLMVFSKDGVIDSDFSNTFDVNLGSIIKLKKHSSDGLEFILAAGDFSAAGGITNFAVFTPGLGMPSPLTGVSLDYVYGMDVSKDGENILITVSGSSGDQIIVLNKDYEYDAIKTSEFLNSLSLQEDPYEIRDIVAGDRGFYAVGYLNPSDSQSSVVKFATPVSGPIYELSVDGMNWVRIDLERVGVASDTLVGNYTFASVEAENLYFRVTSLNGNSAVKGFGVFYETLLEATSGGSKNKKTFNFMSNSENLNTFDLGFVPDPDLLEVYYIQTGQVFKFGAFTIAGPNIVFPVDTFLQESDENVTLFVIQANGSSFDNSDSNAAMIAGNHLGSPYGSLDRSIPGRGVFLRTPNGTLVEVTVSDDFEIDVYSAEEI